MVGGEVLGLLIISLTAIAGGVWIQYRRMKAREELIRRLMELAKEAILAELSYRRDLEDIERRLREMAMEGG